MTRKRTITCGFLLTNYGHSFISVIQPSGQTVRHADAVACPMS